MYGRRLAVALLAILVTTPVAIGSVTAASPSPALVIDVQKDGDATLTVRMTFDLSSEEERRAFRSIENNETTREAIRSQFRARLVSVVGAAENATGREMAISDVSVNISTVEDGTTGVVRLSVTWTNLTTRDDDRLIIREPFASGFSTERRVVLRPPDDFEVALASPEPDARNRAQVVWSAGRDLSGFEVVVAPNNATANPTDSTTPSETERDSSSVEPTASPEDDATPSEIERNAASGGDTPTGGSTTTEGQPGFGIAIAVVAILVSLAVQIREKRARDR